MFYTRTGKCNLCGECCGYPRSTDSGQNNPFPNNWPESVANWQKEDIDKNVLICTLVGHPKFGRKRFGRIKIHDKFYYWIWIPDHGLCKDLPPYGDSTTFDQRCPFLSDKLEDGTVPCMIYGTKNHGIWQNYCSLTPPERFEDTKQIEQWEKNCPSCSFVFEVK